MKKPLVILTGPTAVGKTDLSIQLAKKINGEIISADSIQVYKFLDIGSAKVMPEEMQGIKHYLIDEIDPKEEFNIYKFKDLATKYINEIHSKNKIPIIVGGTGFYIQSVIYDIEFSDTETDNEYRDYLYDYAKDNSPEKLHDLLKDIDPEAANEIHFNNIKRVIRALEYYKQTGEKISKHNKDQKEKESVFNFEYFVLNMDRSILYERINERVDIMLAKGLVKEVEALLNIGLNRNMVSMQGIGYKEIIEYLYNELSLDEAVEKIKKETRHYAKRQLTWFKREKTVTWLDYEKFNFKKDSIFEYMIERLTIKEII